MKFLKITILILFTAQFSPAQDSTVVFSSSMLDKYTSQMSLGNLNGWVFKHGNEKGLENLKMDTSDWEQLSPTELSAKYADENGRVEGWFQIEVKFDSTLLNAPVYFDFVSWAATEFYVDGKLIANRGEMGENREKFRGYNGTLDPVAMRFNNSEPHILTVHIVAYKTTIPPYKLTIQNYHKIVILGGHNYITDTTNNTIFDTTLKTFWLTVCAILSLLFWMLLIQNPKEKNLFWIALFASFFSLFIYFSSHANVIGQSYEAFQTYYLIGNFFTYGTLLILLPMLLIKVFKRKVSKTLIVALIFIFILNIIRGLIPNLSITTNQLIFIPSLIFVFGICLYYVITSWKRLKGAQWAIVVGLIIPVVTILSILLLVIFYDVLNESYYFGILITSILYLSFPLALLAYVSMRFKEIVKEVQVSAERVVELSNEKKTQAENQQKILQAEVARQTGEIRQSLANLKSTQSQLIQSEKMASLGELTAGIAHEIQNPLNFVNNFSEVSNELIDEMNEELDKGELEEVKAISSDIKSNLEKINHHGKRADAIVKGMLQHSRASSAEKEPIDINKLADEYLRLAYHGLRAKDKSFNANLETDYDESIGEIAVIPQDMGRVILNLITNAFYAVSEKKVVSVKNLSVPTLRDEDLKGLANYVPTVSVSTKKLTDKILISVKDNGNGIPKHILDKIFQPFFTTKPTGQGTGLGLSMSYDIITKAHGGELTVETEEGKGTLMKIAIPLVI